MDVKKDKLNYSEIDYRQALISVIKTKYANFLLGLMIFCTFSLIIYRVLPVDFKLKLLFPSIFKKTSQEDSRTTLNREKPKIKNLRKYTVLPGDTLSIISYKFYNDIFAWQKIIDANKLDSPDRLEIGTILIIP